MLLKACLIESGFTDDTRHMKQLKEINKHLDKEHFFCEYEMRQLKENIHRMECVKHAYIEEKVKQRNKEKEKITTVVFR